MKKFILGAALLTMTISSAAVLAEGGENVAACVKTAKEFSGVTLNEFDASYEGNWLSNSVVTWDHARCEVKFATVYELTVKGKVFIYQGYAGKDSYYLYEKLDKKTKLAISKLENRINILRSRLDKASSDLKQVNPNHNEISDYISYGIGKAL